MLNNNLITKLLTDNYTKYYCYEYAQQQGYDLKTSTPECLLRLRRHVAKCLLGEKIIHC